MDPNEFKNVVGVKVVMSGLSQTIVTAVTIVIMFAIASFCYPKTMFSFRPEVFIVGQSYHI